MPIGTSGKVTPAHRPSVPVIWTDNGNTSAPLLLLFPAMGVPAGYYAPFVDQLVIQGFHVGVPELRGQGRYSPRPTKERDHGFIQILTEDFPAVISAAKDRHPQSPLVVAGHSLGGQLAGLYCASNPPVRLSPDALVLIATGTPYYRAYGRRALTIAIQTRIAGIIATALGYFPGHRLGFGGIQPKTLIKEWSQLAKTGHYHITGLPNIEQNMRSIRTPVLSYAIQPDPYAPHGAIAHYNTKLLSAPITELAYTNSEVPNFSLDHFNWVKHSGPMSKNIAQWWLKSNNNSAN
ncbi:MAG: alpha/beta hydrolase family protein [Mycobacteriaceae bacterium]